ncbi:MAG TPA: DUF2281 domain-containing protein [Oscillatoriales cyanobacterium M59_W2019_021]|nr:MAG: DUF2281 domain-containing protein [Cyanobacteria bacterium J055]HIK31977.1 DUF2281 domain-containing protein [Oscillatoriales cyanobacterium M4454_W2019_049]HIK49506.1 DUF2281 domain-containing protein [Oscillatoriales cyanobacterium M59_W2019_021]
MTIAEQIYAIVQTLPPDRANEILSFAEFIRAKHLKAQESLEPTDTTLSWTELVYSLAGSWETE